jgi:hypothetical protein
MCFDVIVGHQQIYFPAGEMMKYICVASVYLESQDMILTYPVEEAYIEPTGYRHRYYGSRSHAYYSGPVLTWL